MNSIIAIIFGAVQGLTEFIPVSSSGHLLLLHEFLPDVGVPELAFDVALHVGTLTALLLFFWVDYWRYIRAFLDGFFQGLRKTLKMKPLHSSAIKSTTTDRKVSFFIFIAIFPAGLAGLFLEDIIETFLRSPWIVVSMLIFVALLFIFIETQKSFLFQKEMTRMTWQNALFIGVAQVCALVPGVSRSGITMIAGMRMGLARDQAARFSFLISMPLIAGAGLKKMIDLFSIGITVSDFFVLFFGMATAACVGYAVIRWLLEYLTTHTLIPFALYRIAVAIIMIIILL